MSNRLKKTLSLLAALALILSLLPAGALADSRTFKFENSAKVNRGWVTISWIDSYNYGPYQVYYSYDNWSGQSSETYWACSNKSDSTTYSKSITIKNFIPGEKYIVYVEDRNGNKIKATYTMYDAGTFQDGKLKASSLKVTTDYRVYNRSASDKTAMAVSGFYASTIRSNINTKSYGMYVRIDYPQLAYARDYHFMVAVTAPNGYKAINTNDSFRMDYTNGGYRFYYCTGGYIFDLLNRDCGYIPTGSYQMDLYLDGMRVITKYFYVK